MTMAEDPRHVFTHGFSQSNLSWSRVVKSELAKEFRMVTLVWCYEIQPSAEDMATALAYNTLSVVKHAKGLFYEGVGHSLFHEMPDRFDGDLAAFVRSVPR